jgi:hypothetical protein
MLDDDLDIIPFTVPPEPQSCMGEPPPLARKPRDYAEPECKHRHKELDPRLRKIECLDCGKTLDPIECLLDRADYLASCRYHLEAVQAYKVKELEKEARDLARKHPLTAEKAVLPRRSCDDPDPAWKRYQAARQAADGLPLSDRLGLLVRAKLLSEAERAEIVDKMQPRDMEAS